MTSLPAQGQWARGSQLLEWEAEAGLALQDWGIFVFFPPLLTWQLSFYQWQGLKSHLELLLSFLVWKDC